MSFARKLVLQPFEAEQSDDAQDGFGFEENESAPTTKTLKKKGNYIKERAIERQKKLLKIIMKLSKVEGYDSNYQIKLSNGAYLPNSDVIMLILHVLSPGKLTVGHKEFIGLLHEAGVTPELLTNENSKAMLAKLQGTSPAPKERPPMPEPIEEQPMVAEPSMPIPVQIGNRPTPLRAKRRVFDETQQPGPRAKRMRPTWDDQDSDDERD